MASIDSEELDIDELVDKEDRNDTLTHQFRKAADYLTNKLLSQGVDDVKLLTLYGYYKQGTEGPCNVPKPSFFDFKGKAKWESWKRLGSLSKDKAMSMYVETILMLDPNFAASDKKETSEEQHWIKVSTMVNEDINKDPCETTLVDLIKDGNIEELENSIDIYEPDELKSVVDGLDEVGLASIHWAADSGHKNIIELLLRNGADINRQDCDGQTALHYAASCGHVDCVKFLLEKGAEKSILDNESKDPYNVASDDEIKELLKNV